MTESSGKTMTEDVRSAVMRCLTHELYVDAPISEIAEACETSDWIVKTVLDDMKLRRVMVHAKMISEQLGMGLDDNPEAVITIALEAYYEAHPQTHRKQRDMKMLKRRLKPPVKATERTPNRKGY